MTNSDEGIKWIIAALHSLHSQKKRPYTVLILRFEKNYEIEYGRNKKKRGFWMQEDGFPFTWEDRNCYYLHGLDIDNIPIKRESK